MSLGSSTHLREEFEGACRRRGRSRMIRASGMRCGVGQEPGQPCGGACQGGCPLCPGRRSLFSADGALCPLGACVLLVHEQEVEDDIKDEDEVNSPAEGTGAGCASFFAGRTDIYVVGYPMHQCTSAPVHQCTNAAGGGGASGWHAPVDDEQRFERGCCRFEEGHFERRDERSKDEGHARD